MRLSNRRRRCWYLTMPYHSSIIFLIFLRAVCVLVCLYCTLNPNKSKSLRMPVGKSRIQESGAASATLCAVCSQLRGLPECLYERQIMCDRTRVWKRGSGSACDVEKAWKEQNRSVKTTAQVDLTQWASAPKSSPRSWVFKQSVWIPQNTAALDV